MLDSTHLLEPVFYGTAKQVCKFLKGQVTENKLQLAIKNQTEFVIGDKTRCIVVEDFEKTKREEKAEEIWHMFKEGEKLVYYVSDQGRVKYKNKATGKESIAKMYVDKQGVAIVRVQKKQVQVKNLVAKHFSREYNEMVKTVKRPVVRVKDGNPLNCNVNNLEFFTNRQLKEVPSYWRKCALYENGERVKTYNSVREAARDLYYNHSDIAHYFDKKAHYKSLPFDLRPIKSRKKQSAKIG